jgi:hypothetical protein
VIFRGKKIGQTPRGNWYGILQDGNGSFHLTVGVRGTFSYEHIENPNSMDALDNHVYRMEDEMLPALLP